MPDSTPAQPSAPSWLGASDTPLCTAYDVALLDLDGTVYAGEQPIAGAAAAIAGASAAGQRVAYITNNASRTPDEVAAHLTQLGVVASSADVLTSAQIAAALLARQLPPDAVVLAVGGAGLIAAVQEQGMRAVQSAADQPVAVIQGWAPDLAWPLLAEGAYALGRDLPWIATNADLTLPTASGLAPGNGSFVALLSGVVGRAPDMIAGKPSAAAFTQAAARFAATSPIVVGDRLDTDIEGAFAAGLPSLLVLTGVTQVVDLLAAPLEHRPTFVAKDLAGLLVAHRSPTLSATGEWTCGGWSAEVDRRGELAVRGAGDLLDGLRAGCAAAWTAADEGRSVSFTAALRVLS